MYKIWLRSILINGVECTPQKGQLVKQVQLFEIRGARMRKRRTFTREFKHRSLQELDSRPCGCCL